MAVVIENILMLKSDESVNCVLQRSVESTVLESGGSMVFGKV